MMISYQRKAILCFKNSLLYREPVQLLEMRFGVLCCTRFKNEFGCSGLYEIEG